MTQPCQPDCRDVFENQLTSKRGDGSLPANFSSRQDIGKTTQPSERLEGKATGMTRPRNKKKIIVRRLKRAAGSGSAQKRAAGGTKKSSARKSGFARIVSSSRRAGGMVRPAAKQPSVSGRKQALKAEDRKKLRVLLLRLKEHIIGQINFLATDNLSRTEEDTDLDFRSEEQGTDNFNRDLALSRVSMKQSAIFEIDEALHRIEQGKYGFCEFCQKPIEKARLMALPYSRLCVPCQSATEGGSRKSRAPAAAVFRDTDAAGAEIEPEEEE